MKKIRKVITTILAALTLVFAGLPVSAQSVDSGAGGAGSITISNASKGQTYTVYKLFDATQSGDGIAYSVPSGKTFTGNDFFTVDNAGNVLAKEGINVGSDDFKTWAQEFGAEVASTKATDQTLAFTGLTYGYYYITSSLGTTITVNSTNPSATVIDKNTTNPDIPEDGGKKIVVNGTVTSETTAKIGDVIDYQILFNATNFVTTAGGASTKQITKYTIVDTPSDLEINQSTVAVTVGGVTVAATPTFADGKMTIVLPWADADGNTIYDSPVAVKVTYKATVKAGAQDGQASNHADITYTTSDGDEEPVPDPDPDPDPVVKTFQFTLKKTDGTKALTGATFRLYDAASNGNEIAVVKNTDGTYRVAEAGETGVDIEAGTAVVKGLKGDNTIYHLEETKAPNGYNILTARKAVTISSTATNEVEVVNKAGSALPSTGSFGTTMFYLAGSVLLVGALVYMISKRRMNNI